MRARIDVSEIEAQTKIRAKYLRALENEEWDLLPGPTFVRSFLRTYAQALGLDAKALVDEYRMNYEQPSELDHQPVMSAQRRVPTRSGSGGPGPSRGYMIAVVFCLVAFAALLCFIMMLPFMVRDQFGFGGPRGGGVEQIIRMSPYILQALALPALLTLNRLTLSIARTGNSWITIQPYR